MGAPAQVGFWAIADSTPERLAIVDAEGMTWTFGELEQRSNQLAHGLHGLGLQRGDGVTIVLPNEVMFVELYLAAIQIGLYLTCINYHLTGPEIAYIVNDCEAKVLVTHERYAAAATVAAENIQVPLAHRFAVGQIAGFRPYTEMAVGQPTSRPDDRSPGTSMLYTSGTTGRPKGVRRPLPEGDPNAAAATSSMLSMLFDIEPGEGVHLVAGPLYHAAPLAFGMSALHLGQTMVLMDHSTPEGTLRLIEQWGVSTSHMVPTMFHRLLALPDEVRAAADTSTLRSVIDAAAPCPVEVKRRLFAWCGPVIYEFYGEPPRVAARSCGPRSGSRIRHCRPTLRRLDVKVFDDDGDEVPTGTVGTVYLGRLRVLQGTTKTRRPTAEMGSSRSATWGTSIGGIAVPIRSQDRHGRVGRRQHLSGRGRGDVARPSRGRRRCGVRRA